MKSIPSMAQRAAQRKWSGRSEEEKKAAVAKRKQQRGSKGNTM